MEAETVVQALHKWFKLGSVALQGHVGAKARKCLAGLVGLVRASIFLTKSSRAYYEILAVRGAVRAMRIISTRDEEDQDSASR